MSTTEPRPPVLAAASAGASSGMIPEAHDLEDALARACEVLRGANRILLTSHRRPDGDGTGSRAGLASLRTQNDLGNAATTVKFTGAAKIVAARNAGGRA